MKPHIYCCQNTAQNFLDHMIEVPNDFMVNKDCLIGIEKEGFIQGLQELTEFIKNIYTDMISDPSGFGFSLIEDIEYKPFNPKAAESKNSSNRFMLLLYLFVKCGTYENGVITVNKSLFSSACKVHKLSNASKIMNKLNQFGLIIDGYNERKSDLFTIDYPDRNLFLNALYGYMKNIADLNENIRDSFFAFHYYLAAEQDTLPINNRFLTFTKYFKREEKEFLLSLDKALSDMDLFGEINKGYRYLYEYAKKLSKSQEPIIFLRCFSEYGKLNIFIKCNFLDRYIDFIYTLPEHIKQIFNIESNCRFCKDNCNARRKYEFEERLIITCGYLFSFNFKDYNPNDISYYIQIINQELDARKLKK